MWLGLVTLSCGVRKSKCLTACTAKTSFPGVGEFVATLLYHGSDACLAVGHSLVKQILHHLPACVPELTAERPALQNESAQGHSTASGSIDRGVLESIILDMDGASCLHCEPSHGKPVMPHCTAGRLVLCEAGHTKLEDALEKHGIKRNFASKAVYKDSFQTRAASQLSVAQPAKPAIMPLLPVLRNAGIWQRV